MLPDAAYAAISFVSIAFFLPLPIFWIVLHRNVEHFRRKPAHALYMKAAMVLLSALFAYSGLGGLSSRAGAGAIERAVGIALLGAGIYLAYRTTRLMGAATLLGMAELKGDKRMLDRDLYRLVRHPRYLAVFMFLSGLFLATGLFTALYLFVYSVVMFHFAAKEEERELEKRLGRRYAAYRKRTGKFLPRLRRA